MSDDIQESPLESKTLTPTHSQTFVSLESAYQPLYAELLAKSRHNDIRNSPVARAEAHALIDQTRSNLQTCSESTTRGHILRVLELQESLLAPIRTLPSDVLTMIFQLVIETSGEPGITYSTQISKRTELSGCIFRLTWICFWWRHEAVSYSTFWSRIKVDLPHRNVSLRTTEMTAFVNECVLRSGVSAPLRVELFLVYPDAIPSVVTTLVAQAHRWRQATFKLSFMSAEYIDGLFPFEPSSTQFPLLKNLSVNSLHPLSNWILDCHPPLQKLELDSLSESYADVIGGRNLKVLKVGCYWGVSLARLLHLCPCLESLTLQSFAFRGNPDAKEIACRSSLMTLDVGGDLENDEKIENGAWNCVTLPKLTKLQVMLPDLVDVERWPTAAYEADTSVSELKEVLKRSECALQHVNLILYTEHYVLWPEIEVEVVGDSGREPWDKQEKRSSVREFN
ncbi:hypothetical protein BDP27DRAFT_1400282 [Rhodocollybia butyracea]|uniref:F-box domain-containing protein n=1 Tax=Rhodocollybia butyracea TaxID=206335 RepID=A0A9P5Q4F1_9AGAR|nr:hypothetical protein BDP27DRAFT_1400282 [Rhodocollybia butyracea]